MKGDHEVDRKGLIREAYRIAGITAPECRSIFLDWALSLPEGEDSAAALRLLLDSYGVAAPDHPMTQVLNDGLAGSGRPRRRGGWRSRTRD
ncbi:hypothetical protein [Antarcticimicrobium sediminis]|uniref:Uncharacterized protein n=1 Tax=Antarcticimicrobium sediminis TaxID=2546227 RepID=A0A4R5F0W2_9RHOB|nr:hypothetical protein [Antarcticimicrobium sediminis]TDE40727.1 hypothetical protein E1B25_00465 [Antarcticimicrobium sediminis]